MHVPMSPKDRLSQRRGKKMLFIHTPKCGGKFVGAAFGRRFRRCISLRHPALKGHLTWRQYRDSFAAIGHDLDAYALFSVVRNPWEWHLSWYHYVRGDKDGKHSGMPDEHALFQKMSFLDYLRWLDAPLMTGKPNQYYLNQVSDWMTDEDGRVRVPDILRQECLADDLQALADKHGVLLNIPEQRINTSDHGDYRAAYCSEGIDIVARRHARDLALFGYDFEARHTEPCAERLSA